MSKDPRPTPARRLRALVLGAVAVLALAGCLRLDLQAVVGADGTVSGTYVVAQDGDELGMTPEDRELVLASPAGAEDFGLPPGTPLEVERYEDGTWVGHRYTFDGLQLADLVGGTAPLTRGDGTFVLALDVAAAQDGEPPAELLLALTFPGPVLETNGTVDPTDPRTARWTSDRSVATTFTAVAADGAAEPADDPGAGPAAETSGAVDDEGTTSGGVADGVDPATTTGTTSTGDAPGILWPWIAGGGVAVLLVTGTVVALLVRRRRSAVGGTPATPPQHPVAPAWAGAPTVHAWQPDPPVGPPPGAVPQQPSDAPRPPA